MQNRLSYSFQTPISPEFFSLLLASYFSKKIAGKIDAALDDLFMKMHQLYTNASISVLSNLLVFQRIP